MITEVEAKELEIGDFIIRPVRIQRIRKVGDQIEVQTADGRYYKFDPEANILISTNGTDGHL